MNRTISTDKSRETAGRLHKFNIAGQSLCALASGALWWPDQKMLTVSDLHFGKSGRILRRSGPFLPPYDTRETLARLESDIENCGANNIVCLGDSFDDIQATQDLDDSELSWIKHLQAGRQWVWIAGNHDPAPFSIGGSHLNEFCQSGLTFRHIALPTATAEVSGHYHPKYSVRLTGRRISRPCFIYDENRLILPAYGTYTGGLKSSDDALQSLFSKDARVVITGTTTHVFPLN